MARNVITVNRGADRVNHVRDTVQSVITQANGGADGVGDVREVAQQVVRIIRVAFGETPAIGQAQVGVVMVHQDDVAGGIHLVGNRAVNVVMPGRGLVLGVGQGQQIAGGVVCERCHFEVRVCFGGFAAGDVVAIRGHLTELISVFYEAQCGIAETFNSAIRIADGPGASQIVKRGVQDHAVGIDAVGGLVGGVVGRSLNAAKVIADRHQAV